MTERYRPWRPPGILGSHEPVTDPTAVPLLIMVRTRGIASARTDHRDLDRPAREKPRVALCCAPPADGSVFFRQASAPLVPAALPSLRSRDSRHFLIFWRAWKSRVLTVPSGQFWISATSARPMPS